MLKIYCCCCLVAAPGNLNHLINGPKAADNHKNVRPQVNRLFTELRHDLKDRSQAFNLAIEKFIIQRSSPKSNDSWNPIDYSKSINLNFSHKAQSSRLSNVLFDYVKQSKGTKACECERSRKTRGEKECRLYILWCSRSRHHLSIYTTSHWWEIRMNKDPLISWPVPLITGGRVMPCTSSKQ